MKYYPQGLKHDPKIVKTRKGSLTHLNHKWDRPSHKDRVFRQFTNYPFSDIEFKLQRGFHPTQKPVALLEYLIKTYTLENETVLDFTAGSFSTGVACINTNRNFIGIEKDDHYFIIGKKRVEGVLNAKIQK